MIKFIDAKKLRNTAYKKTEMIEDVTFKLKRTMIKHAASGETNITINSKSKKGLRNVVFCYEEIISKLGEAGYRMGWDFTNKAIDNGTWFLSIHWD